MSFQEHKTIKKHKGRYFNSYCLKVYETEISLLKFAIKNCESVGVLKLLVLKSRPTKCINTPIL